MTPYTYLLGWSDLNKFYYGVRYAKTCNPGDLWVTYFTSSNVVKSFYQKHGNPDIIEIRETFSSQQDARCYEEKVLRRLDCAGRKDFLNVCNGRAIPSEMASHPGEQHPMFGKKHSDETKEKMKKPKSTSHKANLSNAAKKRWIGVNRSGVNNANFKGMIKTPYGIFAGLKAAALAEPIMVDVSTISNRIKNPKFNNYERVVI